MVRVILAVASAIWLLGLAASHAEQFAAAEGWVVSHTPQDYGEVPFSCSATVIASLAKFDVHLLKTTGEVLLSLHPNIDWQRWSPNPEGVVTIWFDAGDPTTFRSLFSDASGTVDVLIPNADLFLSDFAQHSVMFIGAGELGVLGVQLAGSSWAAATLRQCMDVTTLSSAKGVDWLPLPELTGAARWFVKLDEVESAHETFFARVRIKETTPENSTDAMLVHHKSGAFCGSAGCKLELFMMDQEGDEPLLSLNVDDVQLGNDYSDGYRNLRFNNGVTWSWNGTAYRLK